MPVRFWIVCLMLALLPLRGWAAGSMTVPEGVVAAAAHLEQSAAAADVVMPACHEAAPGESGTTIGHACNLCDLCHSAVADMATPTLAQMPLPDVAPRAALAHDTGRPAVGGLERPPRSPLA